MAPDAPAAAPYGSNPPAPADAAVQPHVAARGAILGRAKTFAEELVHVPEWESEHLPVVEREVNGKVQRGNVLCIELDAGRRSDLLDHSIVNGSVVLRRIYPELVIEGAYHPENRQTLFVAADRDALLADSGNAIEAVASVVGRISGLNKGAEKQAQGN